MEMAAEGPRGWRFFFRSCTLFKYKRRHEEWDQLIRLGQDRRIARCSKTHFLGIHTRISGRIDYPAPSLPICGDLIDVTV